MVRLVTLFVWLNMAKTLLWNVGSPEPSEWLVWASDWLKCGGRFHVAASIDAEG
jgi:hypothetical protein